MTTHPEAVAAAYEWYNERSVVSDNVRQDLAAIITRHYEARIQSETIMATSRELVADAEREYPKILRAQAAIMDQLRSKLRRAVEAMDYARTTIRLWHGEEAWPEYQQSPEMKKINEAIAENKDLLQ